MKNKLTFLFIVLIGLTINPAQSQDTRNPNREHDHNGHFSPNLNLAVPRGEFKNLAPRGAFFGIGGGFYSQIGVLPIDWGASFHYFWMGSESEKFELNDPVIGLYEVDSRVSSAMMPIHVHGRISFLRTLNDFFFPYVEVMGGFRIFNTRSVIEVEIPNQENPEPETDNTTNFTWSYGYGAGAAFRLTTNVLLDARVVRMPGGQAKYLDPESVKFNSNQEPVFSRTRSKTDAMVYQLGLKLKF